MTLSTGQVPAAPGVAYAPGQLVIVSLTNCLENPRARGKRRPAVLVRRDVGHWWIMGLTTNPTYRDGTPRASIPQPGAVGLRSAGFLWGRTSRVSVLDLDRQLGWADNDLVERIISIGHLSPTDSDVLRAAADAHHRARLIP